MTKEEKNVHENSIVDAQKQNKNNGRRGNVAVAKKPYFRSKGSKVHPRIRGYMNIDVTSGTNSIYKNLSPMFLGPINSNPNGLLLENVWQFSKVFSKDVDEKGSLTDDYIQRRNDGFADSKGHRRSKVNGDYQFNYLNGKKYNWVDGKKEIYIRNYVDLAAQQDAYKDLEDKLSSGMNLQIIGYDGFSYDASTDPNGSQLCHWLRDRSVTFGHEFVLAAMLTNVNLIKKEI